ncbi:MAG: HisA/HisF-related TIM barrel protein [Chloroflexota bacterium]
MAVEITRPGKNSLILETPVMPAAGTFGYGESYRDLVNMEKLGAVVTNPVSYEPRTPANGPRVIQLAAGVLMHTGLPNAGINKVLRQQRNLWATLPLPVIVHLIATTDDQVRKAAARLDEEDSVDGIELGLRDDITWQEASRLVGHAVTKTEKPVLVRLPMHDAYEIADAVVDAGASTLVVCAPPRGTARDPHTRQMVSGRIYGPLVKPIALHMVGRIARRVDVPVIGAGGIHNPEDAREFIEAGAVAIQVDSVIWRNPQELEVIARDLGGYIVTRETGAMPDEWHRGMGDTEKKRHRQRDADDENSDVGRN